MVILDDVILDMLDSDAFKRALVENHCVVLHPRGFVGGLNPFTPADEIPARLRSILDAKESVRDLLDAPRDKLPPEVRRITVDLTNPAKTEDIDLARQLSSKIGLEPDLSVRGKLLDADIKEEYHSLINEFLVHQSEVYSLPQITSIMKEHHARLMRHLPPGSGEPYFYLPHKNKSFGMMATAHHHATGTPIRRYIDGPDGLGKVEFNHDSVLIVLDDIAGSGVTMEDAVVRLDMEGYQGNIMLAPLMSTPQAQERISALTGFYRSKISYLPWEDKSSLFDSSFYKGLSPVDKTRLNDVLGDLGYSEGNEKTALSVALPYMSPDNNNALFGWLFAQYFILNQRPPPIGAIKTTRYKPKGHVLKNG